MRTHLSDEKLVDLMDGVTEAATEGHLRECAECRGRIEEARSGMAEALRADVPEPSPLYWEAFHREVGRRLVEDRRPFRWVLGPALAALAAGLLYVALPHGLEPVPPPPSLPAWSALPPVDDDPALEVLQAVAVQLGSEVECTRLEECVTELSDEEGGALAEMLSREMPRRPS